MDVDTIPEHKKIFNRITGNVLSYARMLQSDADKVMFIHNLLVSTNTYNTNAKYDQSSYSTIVLGQAVCIGYSLAFNYYMQRLGISSTLMFDGSVDELHAWNLVELDGEFYNMDVTWNNPVSRPPDTFFYKYFNITDAQMQVYHNRSGVSKSFPAASGTRYAYDNYQYVDYTGFPFMELKER